MDNIEKLFCVRRTLQNILIVNALYVVIIYCNECEWNGRYDTQYVWGRQNDYDIGSFHIFISFSRSYTCHVIQVNSDFVTESRFGSVIDIFVCKSFTDWMWRFRHKTSHFSKNQKFLTNTHFLSFAKSTKLQDHIILEGQVTWLKQF